MEMQWPQEEQERASRRSAGNGTGILEESGCDTELFASFLSIMKRKCGSKRFGGSQ